MTTHPDAGAATEEGTLYERLGGEKGVGVLIDRFYEKVIADPELAPFFAKASLVNLLKMQREFFAAALDGPQNYSGLALASAHAGRHISASNFSRYVTLLLDTLTEIGVKPRDIHAVVDRIAMYADDITGGGSIGG